MVKNLKFNSFFASKKFEQWEIFKSQKDPLSRYKSFRNCIFLIDYFYGKSNNHENVHNRGGRRSFMVFENVLAGDIVIWVNFAQYSVIQSRHGGEKPWFHENIAGTTVTYD